MNRTAVIYESKYGSTKRYAQWIAEELGCAIYKRKCFRKEDFNNYDIIIYGGGLYAGGVSGIELINRNRTLLSGKAVILFTCGITDPEDPSIRSTIKASLSNALSPEVLEHVRLFHLRGSLDYPHLSLVHKSMMSMLRRMLLKKDAESLRKEDKLILEAYGKHMDYTDRNSIQPLIQYAQSIR